MELPFLETKKNNIYYRTFNKNTNDHDLKWHTDNEDRIIVSENKTDWMIQFDNELPIPITENKPIFIKKDRYHRLIKGSDDLTLKLKKRMKNIKITEEQFKRIVIKQIDEQIAPSGTQTTPTATTKTDFVKVNKRQFDMMKNPKNGSLGQLLPKSGQPDINSLPNEFFIIISSGWANNQNDAMNIATNKLKNFDVKNSTQTDEMSQYVFLSKFPPKFRINIVIPVNG